jgi:hypothetical protein
MSSMTPQGQYSRVVDIPPVPPMGTSKYCSKYWVLENAFACICGRVFVFPASDRGDGLDLGD